MYEKNGKLGGGGGVDTIQKFFLSGAHFRATARIRYHKKYPIARLRKMGNERVAAEQKPLK